MRRILLYILWLLPVIFLTACGSNNDRTVSENNAAPDNTTKIETLPHETETEKTQTEKTVLEPAINVMAEILDPKMYDIIEPFIDTTVQSSANEQVAISVDQVFYDGHWMLAGVKVSGSNTAPQVVMDEMLVPTSDIETVMTENAGDRYYFVSAMSNEIMPAFSLLLEGEKLPLSVAVIPCETITITGDEDFRNISISPVSIWIDDYTVDTVHDITEGQACAHSVYVIHTDGTEAGYSQKELSDFNNETILWSANEYMYGDHAFITVRINQGLQLEDVAGIRIDDRTFLAFE